MTPLRLALVTRRFWPMVEGPEVALGNLASALAARGVAVTILTARWQPIWPAQIDHHGVPVVRLPPPSGSYFRMRSYLRSLERWISQQTEPIDLTYVSGLRQEACALVARGRKLGFPVVVRAEESGAYGDVHWQLTARGGRRIKRYCSQAAALLAPTPAIERELIAAGYPRDRIRLIRLGVPPAPERTDEARRRAREALAHAQLALSMPGDAPLAVYLGRLEERHGLKRLVWAWQSIVARHPEARLWLVGDGRDRRLLAREAERRNLAGRVILPGTFDQPTEILQAADLFVSPSPQQALTLPVLDAMAHGLPIVATDLAGNRDVIEDGVHGRIVARESERQLAAAIQELIDDPAAAQRLGEAGRALVGQQYSLDRMVDEHLELFERLKASAP